MSQTIDTKVVEMEFDNRQFEKNVQTSLSTLDKLKRALKFDSTSDGLEKVSKSIKKLDFDPAATSIVILQDKFSALEKAATGALMKIGADVEHYLTKTLNDVTLDPISKGWSKYADKTSSVQTIMAATGLSIEEVNSQLEKLNWFTDETSYNFLDMVNNIGKFTSNRISLTDSVTAMQGISTWAAISGAKVEEASRAMYNLSQAMSVGSVKLIDWKSIENANMATAEFKQTVIDTATKMGTLKKVSEDTWKTVNGGKEVSVKNFNENLKQEWFTSEVLMEALDRYGAFSVKLGEVYDDTGVVTSTLLKYIDEYVDGTIDMVEASEDTGLSVEELKPILEELGGAEYELGRKAFKAAQEAKTFGEAIDSVKDATSTAWMNIFELIFGNYEEAKQLWTDLAESLYDIFVEPLNAVQEVLKKGLSIPENVITRSLGLKEINSVLERSDLKAFEGVFTKVAKAHGIAIDEMIAEEGSFWATIKNGWLTTDLFDEVLKTVTGSSESSVAELDKIKEAAIDVIKGNYGNDMEARKNKLIEEGFDADLVQKYVNALHKATNGTWELNDAAFEAANAELGLSESVASLSDEELEALGYTEDEIKFIRKLQAAAEDASSPVNALVSSMYGRSGRELLIEGVSNLLGNLVTTLNLVGEAWSNVFPPMTGEKLYDLISKFHAFSEEMIFSEETIDKIRTIFESVFSVLSLVTDAIGAAAPIVFKIFGFLATVAFNALYKVSQGIKGIVDFIKDIGIVQDVFSLLSGAIDMVAGSLEKVKEFLSPILEMFSGSILGKIRGGLTSFIKSALGLNQLPETIQSEIDKTYELMPTLKLLSVAYDIVKEKAVSAFSKIGESIKNSPLGKAVKKSFAEAKTAIEEGGISPMKAYIGSLRKNIPGVDRFLATIGELGGKFRELKERIKGAFESFKNSAFFNNLKSIASSAGKILSNTFSDAVTWISGFISKIQNGENPLEKWITKLKEIPILSKAFEAIGNIWDKITKIFTSGEDSGGFLDGIKNFFSDLGEDANLFDLFGAIASSVRTGIDKAINWLKTTNPLQAFLDALHDLFFGMSVSAAEVESSDSIVEEGASNVGDSIIDIIKEKILSAAKAIGNVLSGLSFDNISKGLTAFISVLSGVALLKAIKAVKNISKSISDAINSFASIAEAEAEARRTAAEAKKKEAYTKFIIGVAASILIVVAAIYIVTKMDQSRILPAVGIIALVGVIIVAMASLLGLVQKKLGNGGAALRDAGIGILAFAVGLFILYYALEAFKKLDLSEMKPTTALLLIIIVLLIGVFGAVSKSGGDLKSSIGNAIQMIAFAIAIGQVVKTIGKLAKMLGGKNGKNITKAMGLLVGIMVAMGLALLAVSKIKGAKKAGRALIEIAAAMLLMSYVIKAFAKIKIETILKALPGLLVAVGIIALLIMAISGAGKNATKAGAALILISAALLIMTFVIDILGSMKPEKALQGAAALFVVSLSITLLLIVVGQSGPDAIKAGVAAVLVAASMILIAEAITILSLIDGKKLEGATFALGAIAIVFGLVMVLSNFAKPKITTILAYVIVLGSIVAALWVLTTMDLDRLTTAVDSLCSVLLAVTAAMLIASIGGSNPLGGVMSALKILGFIVTLVGALALIATALDALNISPEAIKNKIEQLSPIFEALGNLVGSLIKGTLSAFNDEGLIESVKGVITFITSLYSSGSLPDSSDTGLLEWFAGKTGSGLDVVARDMGSLGTAIGKFAKALGNIEAEDPNFAEKVEIAKDLTNFVIGLYGSETLPAASESGILEWMVGKTGSGLDVAGVDMQTLAEGIAEFGKALDKINAADPNISEKIDIAKDLTTFVIGLYSGEEALPEASKSSLFEWMAGKTGSGLDVAGKDMTTLAEGIGEFAKALDKINVADPNIADKVSIAKDLTTFVIGLYSGEEALPEASKSSLFEWMAGKTGSGLDVAGEDMTTLAEGIGKFGKALDKINAADPNLSGKVSTAKDLTTFVIGLYSGEEALPGASESGILEWWVGKTGSGLDVAGKDMTTLAEGIAGFGKALDKFDVKTDYASKVDLAKDLATFIVGLYATEGLPDSSSSGLFEWFLGHTGTVVGDISKDLPLLAGGLSAFADTIGESSFNTSDDFTDKVQAAQNLSTFLVGLYKDANTLPKEGETSILEWAKDKTGLDQIGSSAGALATGLAEYADKIDLATFNPAKILASQCLARMLVSLNGQLPDSSLMDALIGNNAKLKKFADQLPDFAGKLVSYATIVKGIDESSVAASVTAATMLSELSEGLKGQDLGGEGLMKWFDESDLEQFGQGIVNLGHYLKEFSASFEDSVDNNGLTDEEVSRLTAITTAIDILIDLAESMDQVAAFSDRSNDFQEFVNSLASINWDALTEVDTVGLEEFSDKLKEILGVLTDADISASLALWEGIKKSFEEAGANVAQGLIDGIMSKAEEARAAGVDLANWVKEGFTSPEGADENSPSAVMYTYGDFVVQGLINAIKDKLSIAKETGAELGREVTDSAAEAASGLPEALTPETEIYNATTGLLSTIAALLDGNTGIVTGAFKGITDNVTQYLAGSKDIFSSLGNGSAESYTLGIDKMRPVTVDTLNNILQAFRNTYTPMKSVSTTLAGNSLLGLKSKVGSVKAGNGISGTMPNAINKAVDWIKSTKTGKFVLNAFKNMATSGLDGIKTKISTVKAGTGIMGTMPNAVNKAVEWIGSTKTGSFVLKSFKTMATSCLEGIKTKIGSVAGGDGIKGTMPSAISGAINFIKNTLSGDSNTAGAKIGGELESGMASKEDDVETEGTKLATKAADGTGDATALSTTKSHGGDSADGFINAAGSTAKQDLAYNAGAALAEAYNRGLKNVEVIASPSHVTYEFGEFTAIGFINGAMSLLGKVEKAGMSTGEAMNRGINRAVSMVSDIMENGLDGGPVITPVLDLSEIQNGASAINGMMAFDTPYSVMANVNGINSAMMASRQQRVSNSDVVDAINGLRDNMSGTGDTYNVNGVTYDDGTNVASAVRSLIHAANINRRS